MTIMFHNANKRYMYILEQAKTGTKGKFSDMHLASITCNTCQTSGIQCNKSYRHVLQKESENNLKIFIIKEIV